MTNGEKIKAMFPSMMVGFITESQVGIYFEKNQHSATVFSLDWWNAEYKEPTTNNAPQEPKTGHWIGTRRVGCGFGEYKEYIVPIKDGIVTDSCHCSECGEWLTGSDEYECYGNYCPNCGAKMVEPQESEDT